jgi:tartrate-resistant acid phosphatase type 5
VEHKTTIDEREPSNRRGEWTRRRFLQQTAKFSALALLDAHVALPTTASSGTDPDPKASHLLLIGDWGTVSEPEQQIAVADGMKHWVAANAIRPDALLMLGDNFYGELPGGVDSERWVRQFEQMYPSSSFPGPAYAVLGNHDYEKLRGNKVEAELEYAKRKTRWTLPSRWYTVTLPEENPLITVVCLDSNFPGSKGFFRWPWSFDMTKEEQEEQQQWLAAELAKPRSTPFLALAAHHPVYSNGVHRDDPSLIARWEPLLRQHKVDLYLSGHDHDLQHLEFAGHPTSFIISGGGGAELVNWTTQPRKRGPFGARALGFTDLELSKDAVILRHIGKDGNTLYEFKKQGRGQA